MLRSSFALFPIASFFASIAGWWLPIALLAAVPAKAQVYKGALVIDADSGEVVFEDQPDYVGPPASITKLMTFLVVHDQIRAGRLTLQTPVRTSAADSRIGGTQVWLKEGEVFTVEELLLAMMVQSANDAAHALAVTAFGSREAALAAMNERSRQLGMRDTVWRSPHGLPPSSRQLAESDLTSPRDLALLSRELLRSTDVLRYTSINRAPFGENKRPAPVMMDNHNNLLGKVRGVDGLKTGFTRGAGFCLAATAERDNRRLIAVIMGSPTSKERDVKMAELLETAFSRLGPGTARPSSPISAAPLAPAPAVSPVKAPAPAPSEPPVLTRVPLSPDETAPNNEPPAVRFTLPPRAPKGAK
jgi:D-alanyl-D-alanine carboxypeptidase